jgi:myosin-crossreactive antigen
VKLSHVPGHGLPNTQVATSTLNQEELYTEKATGKDATTQVTVRSPTEGIEAETDTTILVTKEGGTTRGDTTRALGGGEVQAPACKTEHLKSSPSLFYNLKVLWQRLPQAVFICPLLK